MPKIGPAGQPEDPKLFGRNVREQRALRGWSIEKLASRAGVAPHTLLRIEHGFPSTWIKRNCICYALGVSMSRLEAESETRREDLAVHTIEDERWLSLLDYRSQIPEGDGERIQDSKERNRLAGLDFVPQFVKILNCRLPKGRLVAGIIEVHAPLVPSRYLGGEVFAYVLRGNCVLNFNQEEVPLNEGQCATLDCTKPFFFGPAKDTVKGKQPSLVLYVRLDEIMPGRDIDPDEDYVGWVAPDEALPPRDVPPIKKPKPHGRRSPIRPQT